MTQELIEHITRIIREEQPERPLLNLSHDERMQTVVHVALERVLERIIKLLMLSRTTPGLPDEAYLTQYRRARSVADELEVPIETFLSDWAPSHIDHYANMDKEKP